MNVLINNNYDNNNHSFVWKLEKKGFYCIAYTRSMVRIVYGKNSIN